MRRWHGVNEEASVHAPAPVSYSYWNKSHCCSSWASLIMSVLYCQFEKEQKQGLLGKGIFCHQTHWITWHHSFAALYSNVSHCTVSHCVALYCIVLEQILLNRTASRLGTESYFIGNCCLSIYNVSDRWQSIEIGIVWCTFVNHQSFYIVTVV